MISSHQVLYVCVCMCLCGRVTGVEGVWQLWRSVVQPLAAFCHWNCGLMSSSVSGGLHHLSPHGAKHGSAQLHQWRKQTKMRGIIWTNSSFSVLCWAELMRWACLMRGAWGFVLLQLRDERESQEERPWPWQAGTGTPNEQAWLLSTVKLHYT